MAFRRFGRGGASGVKKRKLTSSTFETSNPLFTIYRTGPPNESGIDVMPSEDKQGTFTQFASLDPAVVNLGVRVEKRYSHGPIVPLLFAKVNLSPTKPGESTYSNLITFLDKYIEIFKNCHVILFERQMVINYAIGRMSQHILSYFLIKLTGTPLKPLIVEIESRVKSGQLGGAMNLKPKQLKVWAITKGKELLEMRLDNWSLQVIAETKKKDDLADTVVQLEALCSLWKLPLTIDMRQPQLIIPSVVALSGNKSLILPPSERKMSLNIAPSVISNIPSINVAKLSPSAQYPKMSLVLPLYPNTPLSSMSLVVPSPKVPPLNLSLVVASPKVPPLNLTLCITK